MYVSMVVFCPLASGSRGNCNFVGTAQTKLLIDAGLSAKLTGQRLAQIGIDLADIDAIVITHDHGDHIAGLKGLAKRLSIPVVCNLETAKGISLFLGDPLQCKIFRTGEPFEIGDFLFRPFSVQHDTGDPVGFVIEVHVGQTPVRIGVCTDLGFVTSLVVEHLKHCCCLFLESNHDPELVNLSLRPTIYKQRVLGRMGHLSNGECGHLLSQVAHDKLQRVYLAHLSEECNREELAQETANVALSTFRQTSSLKIAHQFQISEPILLGDPAELVWSTHLQRASEHPQRPNAMQKIL